MPADMRCLRWSALLGTMTSTRLILMENPRVLRKPTSRSTDRTAPHPCHVTRNRRAEHAGKGRIGVLRAELSASLRENLVGQIGRLSSREAATQWAASALKAKNSLGAV